MFNSFT